MIPSYILPTRLGLVWIDKRCSHILTTSTVHFFLFVQYPYKHRSVHRITSSSTSCPLFKFKWPRCPRSPQVPPRSLKNMPNIINNNNNLLPPQITSSLNSEIYSNIRKTCSADAAAAFGERCCLSSVFLWDDDVVNVDGLLRFIYPINLAGSAPKVQRKRAVGLAFAFLKV